MKYPPVTIVMTTWFVHPERVRVARVTLKSWIKHLRYDGIINLHIADDGSELKFNIDDIWFPSTSWGAITHSRQERRGVGASLNKGFSNAFETSPYVLYMVDDWRLDQSFDITPWVYLLQQREDVGIVRLGPPHPHLRGVIMPYTELWQGWALKLDRYGLTVGDRPMLIHKRWIDYYGWRTEDVNAQECERLESVKYADMPDGPDIVFALYHPWFHIDQSELPSTSHIDPKDN